MPKFVIDTNVAIVANGRCTPQADIRCQLHCVERIISAIKQETIAIDSSGLILDEYKKRLNFSGAPGVGDKFFKHVFDNQYLNKGVQRFRITPINDESRSFSELPTNCFDRSDRKFLAVAVASNAVVLNATDSGWAQHSKLMVKVGVSVEELCPQVIERKLLRDNR